MNSLEEFRLYATLPSFRKKVEQAQIIIESFFDIAKNPYVSWSTGKDSTCVMDMARRIRPGVPVIHFDLGVELPGTEEYKAGFEGVRTWASSKTVIDVIIEQGLGTGKAKKGVLLREFEREEKERDGYLTGMRYDESRERSYLRKYGPTYRKKSDLWVCNPIHNWTYRDSFAYLVSKGIPIHPHYLLDSPQPLSSRRVGGYISGRNRGDSLGRFFWFQQQYPDKFREVAERVPEIRQYV